MPRLWTSRFVKNVKRFLDPMQQQVMNIMEIGVYNSDTAEWLIKNYCAHEKSKYIGIDIWDLNFYNVRKFPKNAIGEDKVKKMINKAKKLEEKYKPKVMMIQGKSEEVLSNSKYHWNKLKLNIVYIDGNHTAEAAYNESKLIWPMIRNNGIVVWDDYVNKSHMNAKEGINRFLKEKFGEYAILFSNRQCGVRKL